MAKLPGAEALGERPVPQLPRRTPLVADYRATSGFEETPSQVMGHSAAEMEGAAHLALQAQEQQDSLRAEDAVTQLRKRQIDLTFGQGGFSNLKGGDAVNRPLLKTYGGEFDKSAASLAAGLDNDYQRQIFTRRAANAGLQLREDIVRHVAHEYDVYATNVFQSKIDTEAQAAAARWATPDAASVPLLNIKNSIYGYAERFGKPKEWVDDALMKAQSKVYDGIIRQASVQDPSVARTLFNQYSDKLTATERAQLDYTIDVHARQFAARQQPVEARNDAQAAINASPVAVKDTPAGPGGFPKETPHEALRAAQLQLGILQGEASDKDLSAERRADLNKEIQRSTTLISTLQTKAAETPVRATAQDVRANLGAWIAKAEELAEQRHPGDVVYRDMTVNRVKSYVSTIVAAQEGEQRQAYGQLVGMLTAVKGGEKPTSQDQLFALPGAHDAFMKLEPQTQAAIFGFLDHNARAAEGKPAQVSAKLVNAIFPRLFLTPDDPMAIYQPQQLAQFVPLGLTPADHTTLARKIQEQQTPEGKGFLSDVEKVRKAAHSMMLRSQVGIIQPDLAEEAALRFSNDLDRKIDDYRKAGKDPRALLTPDTTDYVLKPERVRSFMSSGTAAVASVARTSGGQIGEPGQPKATARLPGESPDAYLKRIGSQP